MVLPVLLLNCLSCISTYTLSSSAEAISKILPLLFELFIRKKDLLTYVEAGRKLSGVRHQVNTATPSSQSRVIKMWSHLEDEVIKMYEMYGKINDASNHIILCSTCKRPWSPEGEELRKCSQCHKVWYCSKKCQKLYVLTISLFLNVVNDHDLFASYHSANGSCTKRSAVLLPSQPRAPMLTWGYVRTENSKC